MSDLMFVSEIGSNFFGSINIAKYLIDQAKESGATHCKFQLFKADDLYDKSWEFYDHAKLCELDYDTARILKEYTDSIGIGWFASVNTKEDIDFLVDIKAPFIKIKSSQQNDVDLITYAKTHATTIVSHINTEGIVGHLDLMTTNKYPSFFEDINFKKLDNFACDGFSDHTQGIQTSLCAAMYPNIRIFEKHFTCNLDKFGIDETQTPDFCVSIYPEQFKEMVEKIRHIKGE